MNKDYGEILLESMSTLLEANTRALIQPSDESKQEKEAREKATLSTADPFLNFFPTATKVLNLETNLDSVSSSAISTDNTASNFMPEGEKISAFWNYAEANSKANILAIEAIISTSRVSSEDPVIGDFGIMVGVQVGEDTKAIYLNRKQMFGNIYNFKQMPHKILVTLPEGTILSSIAVVAYNNATNLNFTIHQITLSLGQDLQVIGTTLEPFAITCAEANPRFQVTDTEEIIDHGSPSYLFEARYVGVNTAGKYYIVQANNLTYCPEDFRVRWYKYIQEATSDADEFGGTNWKYLASGWNYKCIEYDPAHEFEKYKAVLIGTDFEINQQICLTSNEIVVEREIKPTAGFINRVNIELQDKSNGIYPFYEQDGCARVSLLPQVAETRTAICKFETTYLNNNNEINESFYNALSCIEWIYESESVQHLVEYGDEHITDYYTINVFIDEEGYTHYQYTDLKNITADILTSLCSFNYILAKQLNDNNLTDKIACQLSFRNGQSFMAARVISLTKIGLNRTGYTIVSRLFNAAGELVGAIPKNSAANLYYITVDVYDTNGQIVEQGIKQLQSLSGSHLGLTTPSSVNMSEQYWLPQLSTPEVYDFNFNFTNGNNPIHLNDKILVPICDINYSDKVYQGVTTIIYTSEGNKPSYNSSQLKLLPVTGEIIWSLYDGFADASLNPQVENGFFTPVGAWDKRMENQVLRLQGKIQNEVVWDQPVIFMQNKHFSPIIDAWDGRFQINEEGNYIMSSAYVAGGKDNENKFTGLVMGELATIEAGENIRTSEPNATETGMFGYKQGSQSFGFRTDGTAFIGESGGGRINFDGNGGVIYSGNFDGFTTSGELTSGTQGTYLDLKEGLLLTSNGQFRGSLHVATGDLAGWQLDPDGFYRTRSSGNKNYVAGLNSETFNIKSATDIGFDITSGSLGNYYAKISTLINYPSSWEIPNQITLNNRKYRVTRLETIVNNTNVDADKLKTWRSNWESYDRNIKLNEVYISNTLPIFEIDNYFFYYTQDTSFYLPDTISKMGHRVFNSTSKVYLEGEPKTTWPEDWSNGAEVVTHYQGEVGSPYNYSLEDYKIESATRSSTMIRFYAGASKKAPTIEEWETAKEESRNLFLVTDTGDMKVTDAVILNANIEKCTVNTLLPFNDLSIMFGVPYSIETGYRAKAGSFEMVTAPDGELNPTYNTTYTGAGIKAPSDKTFTVSAGNIVFNANNSLQLNKINTNLNAGAIEIGNSNSSASMHGSSVMINSTMYGTSIAGRGHNVGGFDQPGVSIVNNAPINSSSYGSGIQLEVEHRTGGSSYWASLILDYYSINKLNLLLSLREDQIDKLLKLATQ